MISSAPIYGVITLSGLSVSYHVITPLTPEQVGLYCRYGYFQKLHIHLVAGGAIQAGLAFSRHCDWLILPGDVPALRHGFGRARNRTRRLYCLGLIPATVKHYLDMVGATGSNPVPIHSPLQHPSITQKNRRPALGPVSLTCHSFHNVKFPAHRESTGKTAELTSAWLPSRD